ncbi:hypothetical protein OF83DRAFT_608958 [Amylostereum chailletii]|nr:hypothetical protein OF83DRAFT_608958 [Amylostereum chailletii]
MYVLPCATSSASVSPAPHRYHYHKNALKIHSPIHHPCLIIRFTHPRPTPHTRSDPALLTTNAPSLSTHALTCYNHRVPRNPDNILCFTHDNHN